MNHDGEVNSGDRTIGYVTMPIMPMMDIKYPKILIGLYLSFSVVINSYLKST